MWSVEGEYVSQTGSFRENLLEERQTVCVWNNHCCCQVNSVMSDSVQPHRRQPTRLHCPWDSPVKNTGVGCHFLFQCMKVKRESEVSQSCPTPSNPMDCSPPGSSIHRIFQARVLEWVAIAFSIGTIKGLLNANNWERSFYLEVISYSKNLR